MRARLHVAVLAVVTLLSTSAHGGFPGCLWDGVKNIVSAPVKAVGWVVGQGVNSAVDPSLDNAFGRLREASDHAMDRLDQISTNRIDQADKAAKERLNQLDQIAAKRIDQLDNVMQRRLDQVDEILGKNLKEAEAIGVALLEREADILDSNVTRLDDIIGQSLDRLQNLETDAFDRLEGAVQDQVPYAASQVAQTMEWTAGSIVFIVVLVGLGGIDLLRKVRAAGAQSLSAQFTASLKEIPATLLLVGVPMVALFAVVQTGYYVYCSHSDSARIARLEDAATILERAGDFKGATAFRKRLFALKASDRARYGVARDEWLAGFWQKHFGKDPIELERQLVFLTSSSDFEKDARDDAELQAALIYLAATSHRNRLTDIFSGLQREGSEVSIEAYKKRFLGEHPTVPVLGKLVYMAEIRLELEKVNAGVGERLKKVESICNDILQTKPYRTYAPALALRSHVRALQLELEMRSLAEGPIKNEDADNLPADEAKKLVPIQQDYTQAITADPNLMRFIRFRSYSMPKELVDNLQKLKAIEAAKRAELKDSNGQPLTVVTEEQLKIYASDLDALIRPLLGMDTLVRPKVEKQVFQRMRQELGERELREKVGIARMAKLNGENASEKYKKFVSVYEAAEALDKLHVAEAWLAETLKVIADAPASFTDGQEAMIAKKLEDLRSKPATSSLFYVF